MIGGQFTITVFDGTAEQSAFDEAAALYREVYAEPPYFEGLADFVGFAEDLPLRAKQENFRLVIARLASEAIGFALGHQLAPATHWWEGALRPLGPEITTEYAGRTFAVIELAVRIPYRQHSIGRALHAHLTADLTEQRQTLLVRPDAAAANNAYRRWGYREVGKIRPHPASPIYDALVLPRSQIDSI